MEEIEVKSVDIVVSKGDEKGDITYVNPIFVKLSEYTQAELLEKPHAILRHPDMPKVIFKFLWDNLKNGKDVKAFVKNRTKNGNFYWVFAHVRVATNPDGSFRNYVSTRRGMSKNARAVIEPLYMKMVEEEKNGIDGSLEILGSFLRSNGTSIDNFNDYMTQLQNS